MRSRSFCTALAAAGLLLTGCGAEDTPRTGAPAGTPPPVNSTSSPSPADNGVAGLSAEEVVGRSKAALAGADYVRISGSGEEDGSRLRIDMRYGPDRAVGTFTLDGQQLALSRMGRTVYLKGGAGFWTAYADAGTAKLVAGKYLKVDADDRRFTDLTDFADLHQAAYNFLTANGAVSKGKRTSVSGTPAVEIVDQGEDGGTLTVATTGRPYPLTLVSRTDRLAFTDFGTPISVPQPPAAQIVDVDSLPAG